MSELTPGPKLTPEPKFAPEPKARDGHRLSRRAAATPARLAAPGSVRFGP